MIQASATEQVSVPKTSSDAGNPFVGGEPDHGDSSATTGPASENVQLVSQREVLSRERCSGLEEKGDEQPDQGRHEP